MITKIKGHENLTGPTITCDLGDLYNEEVRDILAIITVPPVEPRMKLFIFLLMLTSLVGELYYPAVNITLNYTTVHGNVATTKKATAYLKRPGVAPTDQPVLFCTLIWCIVNWSL